jgi:uncharacterized membrane protein
MTRTEHDWTVAATPGEPLEDDSNAAPVRSVRRATARRASHRRATARHLRPDTDTSIVDFVRGHAGSTAGDLAKALNLSPGWVSGRLDQLVRTGRIKRAAHGYRTRKAKRPAAV